jgi:DHA3 family macrolide efflux protein-like MFS transporter
VADRWNRRRILILADGTVALATLALLIVFALGRLEVWHVYAALLVRSAAGSFHYPAMQASVVLLVPKEQITRVGGLNQALWGINNILSPALGALLLALFDLGAVLSVDIVTALLAIVPLLFVAIPQPQAQERAGVGAAAAVWHDMRDGLRYMWRWRGLRIVLLIGVLGTMVLTPAFALLPLVVNSVFGGGAGQLALAEGAYGVGVILGGLMLAAWRGKVKPHPTAMTGIVGMGFAVLLIGVAPVPYVGLVVAGMFLAGVTQSMMNAPLMATLQQVVDPAMQGRVMAMLGSLIAAVAPLSLAVAGPVADAWGVRVWYIVGGVVELGLGVFGWYSRDLRNLEHHDGRIVPAPSA